MKKLIYVVLFLVLVPLCMTGCGSTDSSNGNTQSKTYEEQTNDNNQKSAVKARVEMDEYQIHLDDLTDVTLYGTINHSYGQDVVALNLDGEEVARTTLKGNNGEEEDFKIVIPSKVLTKHYNPVRVKGMKKGNKVLETYTKLVQIYIGSEE